MTTLISPVCHELRDASTRRSFPAGLADSALTLSACGEALGRADQALDAISAYEGDALLGSTADDVDVESMEVFDSPLSQRLDAVAAGRAHYVNVWNGSDRTHLHRVVDDVLAAVGG